MEPTQQLTAFAFNLNYSDLPDAVVEKLKLCIIDSLANIIGAQKIALSKKILSYVKSLCGPPESLIIGTQLRTSYLYSALANGVLFSTLGSGDGFNAGGNHPGGTVLPVVYALLEKDGLTGENLLCAAACGYEISCRIASGVYPSHATRGFNSTGTMGTIGAAVTGAKMLDYGQEEINNAIGISGFLMPLTPYETINQGYTVSPFNCGNSARVGLESAFLAREGFTGDPFILEGQKNNGICKLTSTNPDFDKMTEGLGKRFMCEEVYLKPYPSVRPSHGPVDALLEIKKKHNLNPRDVNKIIVKTYQSALRFQRKTDINCSPFACRMSIPYVLAAAFFDGELGPFQFEAESIGNQAIHKLADRIEISEKEEYTQSYPTKTACDVEIVGKDGRLFSHSVKYAKGDTGNPFSKADTIEKFNTLVHPLMDSQKRETVISQILNLETLSSMKPLIDSVSVL